MLGQEQTQQLRLALRDDTQIHAQMSYRTFNAVLESIAAMDAAVINIRALCA
jgi:methionine synthase II (cobalamin-independent)